MIPHFVTAPIFNSKTIENLLPIARRYNGDC